MGQGVEDRLFDVVENEPALLNPGDYGGKIVVLVKKL